MKKADWFMLAASIVFLLGVFCPRVHAQDKCQDPSSLSPQMKKAYYELKKASQELGGFSVSIKCGKEQF